MQIKRTESGAIPDSVPKSSLIKLSKIWGSVQLCSQFCIYNVYDR